MQPAAVGLAGTFLRLRAHVDTKAVAPVLAQGLLDGVQAEEAAVDRESRVLNPWGDAPGRLDQILRYFASDMCDVVPVSVQDEFAWIIATLLVLWEAEKSIEDRVIGVVLVELVPEARLALELRGVVAAAVAVPPLHVVLRVPLPIGLTIPPSVATLEFTTCARHGDRDLSRALKRHLSQKASRTMHLEVTPSKSFAIEGNVCHIHIACVIVLRVLVIDLPAEIGGFHRHVDLVQLHEIKTPS